MSKKKMAKRLVCAGMAATLLAGLSTTGAIAAQGVTRATTEESQQVSVDHAIPFSQVNVTDSFWTARQKQFICEVIPTAITRVSTGGGGIPNFQAAAEYLAGKTGNYTTEDGPAHQGAKYVDSDVYKLVEGMAYALQLDSQGDPEVEEGQKLIRETLDLWIPWFVGSQEADGYLYTCFTLNSGEIPANQLRFTGRRDDMPVNPEGKYDTVGTEDYDKNVDFDDHELYCAGHFYEAAVALYRSTGDMRLLDVAVKNADLVAKTFGLDEGKVRAVPGHQEIELALVKLAELCQEIGTVDGVDYAAKADSYIAVAKYFLDDRGGFAAGLHDGRNDSAAWWPQYSQAHLNAADQMEAVGHCVRAQYMYTGMADVALMEVAAGRENPYDTALKSLWEDVTYRKQYITGGVGRPGGEAFGAAYDLPNDDAYCETCAQISNAMWNERMNLLYGDSKYVDVIENDLYNAIISCVNLDGNQFFYGNPMQSYNGNLRSDWFGTACCPPNLMRTVCSIGGYIYTQDSVNGNLTINQYIGNTADFDVNGDAVTLEMETDMPWYGTTTMTVEDGADEAFAIRFRVPSWATGSNTVTVNGEAVSAQPDSQGYVVIDRVWTEGDVVELDFPMEATRVYSDENVTTNEGLVAFRRGPMIYVPEQVDNELNVRLAWVPQDAELKVGDELVRLPGRDGEDSYGVESYVPVSVEAKAKTMLGSEDGVLNLIPYFMWGNRGKTTMKVYQNEEEVVVRRLEAFAQTDANFTSIYDSLGEINDGNKSEGSRWTAYGTSTKENWVEYSFTSDVILRGSYVTWYSDGGGVTVPTKLVIQYWDGANWVDVENMTNGDQFPAMKEQYYGFDEIQTTKIRLNITSGTGAPGITEWRLDGEAVGADPIEPTLESRGKASASFTSSYDSIDNINDGDPGADSRWTAYGTTDSENWVEYAFDMDVMLRGCYVTWYDDNGGVTVPSKMTVQYWNGENWVEVDNLTNADKFPKMKEQYYGFDEIQTTKIRLLITSGTGAPGITEWRLDGEVAEVDPEPTPTPTPTPEPTPEPTVEPTAEPTVEPTVAPTAQPTIVPTTQPTAQPTDAPEVPDTGDHNSLLVWMGTMMGALAASTGLMLWSKKRTNGDE